MTGSTQGGGQTTDLACWWLASLVHTAEGVVLADEYSNCPVDIDTDLDGDVVILAMLHHIIMFSLPQGTANGWVQYNLQDGYATVNGKRVTVLIGLREDV